MAQHYHYTVQGFREWNGPNLDDSTTVEIIVTPDHPAPKIKRLSDSRRFSDLDIEQYAIEEAQRFVKKPKYRVASVITHDFDACPMAQRH